MLGAQIGRTRKVLPLLVVATIIFDIITIRSVETAPTTNLLVWIVLYFLVTFAVISGVYCAYSYLKRSAQLES